MYPNNGYYWQPYGQPYPSGNPYVKQQIRTDLTNMINAMN